MTSLAPYSGSLLRLALTTVVLLAFLAAAVSWWQGALSPQGGRRSAPAAQSGFVR